MVLGCACGYIRVMNSSAKQVALFMFAAALLVLATTSCQTSKGFGKDVEKLGEKIQDKAK
jgi:predicted small secreted protein